MRIFVRLSVAIAAVTFSPNSPSAADDAMKVHFIDVGQGAATLVQFPCATILIDAGGERFPTEEWDDAIYDSTGALMVYLDAFFAERTKKKLDLLILTHPHKDHTRGVPAIVEKFEPANIVHNGRSGGSGGEEQAVAVRYARDNSDSVKAWYVLKRKINDGGLTNSTIDPITCESTQTTNPVIRVLWGQVEDSEGWDEGDFAEGNNHSVVIRIDYGDASILFLGDLEETASNLPAAQRPKGGIEHLVAKYKNTGLLDVDVYHVGHHGSHNGTTPALITAMSPEIAVISAGPACERGGYSAWNHGHPRSATMSDLETKVTGTRPPKNVKVFKRPRATTTKRLEKAIYSTSWDGTVVLEGRPDGTWTAKTSEPHACVGDG